MKAIVLFCQENTFKDKEDRSKESIMYKLTLDVGADGPLTLWSKKPYAVDSEVELTIYPDNNGKPKVKIA